MERTTTSLEQRNMGATLDRRMYNALTYGIVTLCFAVTYGMYNFVQGGGLRLFSSVNPILLLGIYLGGTFGGIIVMNMGKSRENVTLSAVGLTVFTLTFGGSLSLMLTRYTSTTISYAFAITACISGIFLIAGVLFPSFFASMGRVLLIGLLALIVVEAVAVLILHVNQTAFDYITILLFCGFLGYDSYLMSADAPTVPNAIFYAANIYIDIVNVLIRVLSILNRDR